MMRCGNTLRARRAILLAGVMLAVLLSVSARATGGGCAACRKGAALRVAGWYFYGDVEVGGRAFIQRPPIGLRPRAASGQLADPGHHREHRQVRGIRPGPAGHLRRPHLGRRRHKGRPLFDRPPLAKDVGYNNQSYYATLMKVGEHYLTVGWDQTPHLISTSAKTIYQGVGTTNLTIDNDAAGQPASQLAERDRRKRRRRDCAHQHRGLRQQRRGKPDIGARGATRRAASTDMRRTATGSSRPAIRTSIAPARGPCDELGVGFGAAPGFPSNFVETIQPIDDRTQDVNAMSSTSATLRGASAGFSNLSIYGLVLRQFAQVSRRRQSVLPDMRTGAGGPARPQCPAHVSGAEQHGECGDLDQLGRYALAGRYTGTVQYNVMRQDDPFISSPRS